MASNSGLEKGWDAKKMLDLYIYDYMKKNNMPQAAETFARETNILEDLPPTVVDSDEGLLTEWWSIFWATYCARSSSSVQIDNALQSIHHETPVVGLDSTMMMGQQPAGQLLAANNYQLGDLGISLPLFELNPQLQVHARQVQAQAQADRQARVQAISRAQTIAGACSQQEELRAQLHEMAQLQEIASSNNISYEELLALRMGAQTQQQVPPSGIRHGVIDQPAVGHLLNANNNQLGDLPLIPAHFNVNSLLVDVSPSQAQAQALANRQERARVRRAELIAEVEGMASSSNASSRQLSHNSRELHALIMGTASIGPSPGVNQQRSEAELQGIASSSNDSHEELLALRVGAETQQQDPPSGIRHGVNDEPDPLGADLDSTMMTRQQPAQAQAEAKANRQARVQARTQARVRQAQPQLQTGASSSNVSSHLLSALRMAIQTQRQVPPRGNQQRAISPGATRNDGASPGANQQRSEADEGKEMGSGSDR